MNLCKNCKHAREPGVWEGLWPQCAWASDPWICMHPMLAEPVEGISKRSCSSARTSCSPCGEGGKLWEEGSPAPSRFADKVRYPTYEPPPPYIPPRVSLVEPDEPQRGWWRFWA